MKQYVLLSALALCAACTGSPASPTVSPAAVSSTAVIVDGPGLPQATGDDTTTLYIHVVEFCPPHSPIVANARPIAVSFSNGTTVYTDANDNATAVLPYGSYTWQSVAARGYDDAGETRGSLVASTPTASLLIEQRRLCGGPGEPPPVPPPTPVPPVPVPPVPPPPTQCAQTSHADPSQWLGTPDKALPITATVRVHGEGAWTLTIMARHVASGTVYEKASDSRTLVCGQDDTLTATYPFWGTHIATEWWRVVKRNGAVVEVSPVTVRP